jgi:hypothetical protein
MKKKTCNSYWKLVPQLWVCLIESWDIVIKMFLYDKMQTFQIKKNDNITKHVHTLKSLLE